MGHQFDSTTQINHTIVIIETTMGSLKIGLYDSLVPITVTNFLDLVTANFYDELIFHRVIDNFVIQGGGYDINGTLKESPLDPIVLEIHPYARHVNGAIGMARGDDINSATSQFYICDGPQHYLDENYAVFGVVLEGMNIVQNISSVETTEKFTLDNWPVNDIIITDISIQEEKTWYVDDDNKNGPWDGSQLHPFQYIQDAVDHAYENNKVIIAPGIYDETITISTPVHLYGLNKNQTIITSKNSTGTLFLDSIHFCSISNLTFSNTNNVQRDIIKLINCTHCTLQNINILSQNLQRSAISLNGSYNRVENVYINGEKLFNGIKIIHGSNNYITTNRIESSTAGIYVFRSQHNIITSNSLSSCAKAITIEEAHLNQINSNQIMENEQGIFLTYACNNNIEKNDFINNTEQAKFAKFLQIDFLIPNKWRHNYWDDFNRNFFKSIPGILYIPIGSPIGFFIPWFEFDYKPQSHPNNTNY